MFSITCQLFTHPLLLCYYTTAQGVIFCLLFLLEELSQKAFNILHRGVTSGNCAIENSDIKDLDNSL